MTTVIELHGVSLEYPGPPSVNALRPTDLEVTSGEYLTVSGRSGAGKTTLLYILGLLARPTTGIYNLAGVAVNSADEHQIADLRATTLGYVFQQSELLDNRTLLENVMMGLLYRGIPRRAVIRRAHEAIERVGLGHRHSGQAKHLSGGERQRAAVARALVSQPLVLLADEPTGALDSSNAKILMGLLRELNEDGLTIVVVTHDDLVAAQGNRHVNVADGIVTEEVKLVRP